MQRFYIISLIFRQFTVRFAFIDPRVFVHLGENFPIQFDSDA